MNVTALLVDLRTAGIAVQVHAGRLKLDAPRGALTESVLSAVRDSKAELLKLLEAADVVQAHGAAALSGPGAGSDVATLTPARTAPVESIAQSTQPGDDSKVDAEFDRFFACAISTPNGLGLYDPVHGAPEMPSGVPGADWDAFVADCGNLGRGSRA